MAGIKYKSGTVGSQSGLPPIGSIPENHGLYMFPLHCVTSDQTVWSGDPCKACVPPPPPQPGGIVPPDATAMGEITCYWVQQSPGVGGSIGCQERDTNLVTGEVTESVPINPPTLYSGWTLIVSTALGWSGGATGQGQRNFPDVQYTGIGDPTADAAGVNQAIAQASATLAAAAQPSTP
jgi:hypothetical protein